MPTLLRRVADVIEGLDPVRFGPDPYRLAAPREHCYTREKGGVACLVIRSGG
jgi:hypothetical protein